MYFLNVKTKAIIVRIDFRSNCGESILQRLFYEITLKCDGLGCTVFTPVKNVLHIFYLCFKRKNDLTGRLRIKLVKNHALFNSLTF